MTQKTPGLIPDHAYLIVHGEDKPGIVAAVTALITRQQGNIVALSQYSDDPLGGAFFQRVVFHRKDLNAALPDIQADLTATLGEFQLEWTLRDMSVPKRMAILASTSDHCLLDLLWRHRRGELPVTIPMVISNHTNTADDVRSFGIPFFHIPSFLPAFIGAAPYRKAKERGVKLIGATSHYVTQDLDEGPIIEQDTVRVTHADSAVELARRGADVERQVLSRAVLWHSQDRVIRHGNQTIVF